MICETYATGTKGNYKYVVILSFYDEKILLSRHKRRRTWETQGGHIEPGETPIEAARRELFEESGAVAYEIMPVCDYWVMDEQDGSSASGMVFRADIRELSDIPESEMAEVGVFETLPDNLTYPEITPKLFAEAGVPLCRVQENCI